MSVNLWASTQHALDYLGRADAIPHRVEGDEIDPSVRSGRGDAVGGVVGVVAGFYGGWITDRVVGPFKGGPGTHGW